MTLPGKTGNLPLPNLDDFEDVCDLDQALKYDFGMDESE